MDVIPAIDLIDGKCVRLREGDFATQQVYHDDPVAAAQHFESAGLRRLHLVDLDGARAGRMVNHAVLAEIAAATGLAVDYSGGIRSDADIDRAFELGARQVCCGSVAVAAQPLFLSWLSRFGADRIILAADTAGDKVSMHGWQETSDLDLMRFIEHYAAKGVRTLMCTDIARDGLLQGAAVERYRRIRTRFPEIDLIASGGITTIADLDQLRLLGCAGAIVGRALYEGRITLQELAGWHAD